MNDMEGRSAVDEDVVVDNRVDWRNDRLPAERGL